MKRQLAVLFTALALCVEIVPLLFVANLPSAVHVAIEAWWVVLLIVQGILFHIATALLVYTFATLKHRFVVSFMVCFFSAAVGTYIIRAPLSQSSLLVALIVLLVVCGLPLVVLCRSMWPAHEAEAVEDR